MSDFGIRRRSYLAAAIAVVLLAGGWSAAGLAQTSRSDGPVDCNAFQRTAQGSWTVLRPATIYPRGMALSLAPGQSFAPNQMVDGIEVTAVLDRNCGNR